MGSSSREQILERVRAYSRREVEPRPDMTDFNAITFPDKIQQFVEISKAVGGDAIVLQDGQDINAAIRAKYPDAKTVACVAEGVSLGTFDPDSVAAPGELNGTDLAIIPGRFGVCENGCVWVEPSWKWRALCFIAENLVMVIPKEALYHNMHEAYAAVGESELPYRVMISGPSKTADIEQALVMGAHGPKSTLVVLR